MLLIVIITTLSYGLPMQTIRSLLPSGDSILNDKCRHWKKQKILMQKKKKDKNRQGFLKPHRRAYACPVYKPHTHKRGHSTKPNAHILVDLPAA